MPEMVSILYKLCPVKVADLELRLSIEPFLRFTLEDTHDSAYVIERIPCPPGWRVLVYEVKHIADDGTERVVWRVSNRRFSFSHSARRCVAKSRGVADNSNIHYLKYAGLVYLNCMFAAAG